MTVYILYEERENSQLCGIKGVWNKRKDAIDKMEQLINENDLYSEYSKIDILKGCAESDPLYTEERYSNYSIKEIEIA